MICDGLDEISIHGIEFVQSNGKNNLILSWITYLSTIYNPENKAIEDILTKVLEFFNFQQQIIFRNGKVKTT